MTAVLYLCVVWPLSCARNTRLIGRVLPPGSILLLYSMSNPAVSCIMHHSSQLTIAYLSRIPAPSRRCVRFFPIGIQVDSCRRCPAADIS